MIPGEHPVLERRVCAADALAVLTWIGPDYSMEDAMRLLYPENAAKIYNPGKWPWGAPKE
jgi:hypothetical protein